MGSAPRGALPPHASLVAHCRAFAPSPRRGARSRRTFAVGCGALLAGLFGMNLQSGLEQSPYAFYTMVASVFAVSTTTFGMFLRRMHRLVRNRRLLP